MRSAVGHALDDETGSRARVAAARALGEAMSDAGHLLWHVGYLLGPDRAQGDSPFGFGSDLTVGLGTALQIAAEVAAGTVTLLDAGNRYGAMALVRQLVEVEYVAWAFAEDRERTAAAWLRSSADERKKLWQPRHLRDSSAGRFRATDYGSHCEHGGHPTPSGRDLLPDHSDARHESWIWLELCLHGFSAWDYFSTAITTDGQCEIVAELPSVKAVGEAWDNWQSVDPLPGLVGEVRMNFPQVDN